ncbi:MAG: hypothetical protein ACREUV_07635 [Burkholderiales bacterium]
MKTTLEISDALFREAKATAAMRGQSLKDLITDAVRREIRQAKPAKEQSTARFWNELKTVAKANAKAWKSKQGAVEAIKDQRRG